MTILLTPEHERIIRALLTTGRFRSVEEVLDKVLAPFEETPAATPDAKEKAELAAERIRELRKGLTLDRPEGMSMREYAHLGHKY